MHLVWVFGLGLVASATAQATCDNFGTVKSDGSCECPPGFGGATCSEPACGGNLFNGPQRTLSQNSSTGGMSFAGCGCQDGWGGAGCNVCRSPSICQTAFSAAGGPSSGSGLSPISPSQVGNQTLTCATQSRVYAAQQMSCAVINPTLQALFPLSANLNILRTLDPTLSPSPNVTSFGTAGSAFAQVFYDGVEQFYCQAGGCKQTVGNDTTDWACESLKCRCRPGTAFCGAQKNTDLSTVLNSLSGSLTVSCTTSSASCAFKQSLLQALFGSGGLGLSNCVFGECVRQSVVDSALGIAPEVTTAGGESLSGGVIAGLAVIGVIVLAVAILVAWGCLLQRRARATRNEKQTASGRRVGVEWKNVYYVVYPSGSGSLLPFGGLRRRNAVPVGSTSVVELHDLEGSGGEKPLPSLPSSANHVKSKTLLSGLSGSVRPGQMLAILGPSGAGKTTLIGILAGRSGAMGGRVSGDVGFTIDGGEGRVKVGFVDQTDVLPPNLTVIEALLFAAKLKLPESTPPAEKLARVEHVIRQLGLSEVAHSRIGGNTERGLSGGERRRVSIALEIVAGVEVLVLDEPTSGLDSVSAANVARVLAELAHDPENPVAVIASIHQPSSRLYHQFDQILLLSRGEQVYFGPGGTAPVRSLESRGARGMEEGYNVADWLLEVASEGVQPPSRGGYDTSVGTRASVYDPKAQPNFYDQEHGITSEKKLDGSMRYRGGGGKVSVEEDGDRSTKEESNMVRVVRGRGGQKYAATFLTQVQVLCGREWKNLKRDKTLFYMHLGVACILGIFTGGLYFKVGVTISGFQNRVGSLFFMGSLLAFSSLSALYNLVEIRPLFTRERAGGYYSPAAWLVSRVLFDVLPLRIAPTLVMTCITYWMVGLSPEAARFFKALLVLVLYALAMTLFVSSFHASFSERGNLWKYGSGTVDWFGQFPFWELAFSYDPALPPIDIANFLLATSFRNGGVAILLSALFNLFTMTYAGFFVNLSAIPPVLRWLQYFSILKYLLEALAVNEVGSGLMIQDTLEGVPVNVSASLIMELLFGFGENNYYRCILVPRTWAPSKKKFLCCLSVRLGGSSEVPAAAKENLTAA
ncbi:ABC-2 type transporter [Rhizoctonia solani]|uniref:ABC-2 type transporter n=1 Tax=Rhizoctonia solani TaxID=456999 RepID=A0A8H7M2E4_9AGAM|nr:ABC-2 type transporter [Rhizoctonia solani]